jgi:hypothetical protein
MAGMTLWFMAGEQNAAANIVDRALALNPNSAYVWNTRGWLVALQDQPSRGGPPQVWGLRLSRSH